MTLDPGTQQERPVTARDGNVDLAPGQVVRYELGGGGGFGDPFERPAEDVLADVLDGYVSLEGARRDHGVVVVRGDPG